MIQSTSYVAGGRGRQVRGQAAKSSSKTSSRKRTRSLSASGVEDNSDGDEVSSPDKHDPYNARYCLGMELLQATHSGLSSFVCPDVNEQ